MEDKLLVWKVFRGLLDRVFFSLVFISIVRHIYKQTVTR